MECVLFSLFLSPYIPGGLLSLRCGDDVGGGGGGGGGSGGNHDGEPSCGQSRRPATGTAATERWKGTPIRLNGSAPSSNASAPRESPTRTTSAQPRPQRPSRRGQAPRREPRGLSARGNGNLSLRADAGEESEKNETMTSERCGRSLETKTVAPGNGESAAGDLFEDKKSRKKRAGQRIPVKRRKQESRRERGGGLYTGRRTSRVEGSATHRRTSPGEKYSATKGTERRTRRTARGKGRRGSTIKNESSR